MHEEALSSSVYRCPSNDDILISYKHVGVAHKLTHIQETVRDSNFLRIKQPAGDDDGNAISSKRTPTRGRVGLQAFRWNNPLTR